MYRRLSQHNFPACHNLSQIYGSTEALKYHSRKYFDDCKNLFRKDLFGHYGCVNALEFSNEGSWLASGGDDRRVLLWKISESVKSTNKNYAVMKCQHMSNIFCIIFDAHTSQLFSSGNDEQVVQHNIETREATGYFHHDEAVYSLSQPTDNCHVFASASEDGTVVVWDIRCPQDRVTLCTSNGSFHGVSFNPVDPRLLAAANSHEGVLLFDVRKPNRTLIKYGAKQQLKNAMSVRFNYSGNMLYCLYRKSGPILFDLSKADPKCKFDDPGYSNICTMKSACFAGDKDQYVISGSDNFCVYVWKIPESGSPVTRIHKAFLELQGHRSIVNQVRCSRGNMILASAGVEKIVKLWSPHPMQGSLGGTEVDESFRKRQHYSHEEYMRLILQSGQPLTHDYESQSTEEDPRMIAFFDSLIHRVSDGWSSDDSASESSMDGIFQMLINQSPADSDQEQYGDVEPSENVSTTATIAELRRLFRRNRRMLMREFGIDGSDSSDDDEEDSFSFSEGFSERRDFENASGLEIVRNRAPRTARASTTSTSTARDAADSGAIVSFGLDVTRSSETENPSSSFISESSNDYDNYEFGFLPSDSSLPLSSRRIMPVGGSDEETTSPARSSSSSFQESQESLRDSDHLDTSVVSSNFSEARQRSLATEGHCKRDHGDFPLPCFTCTVTSGGRRNRSNRSFDICKCAENNCEGMESQSCCCRLDVVSENSGTESSDLAFNRRRGYRKRTYRDHQHGRDYS